MPFNVSTSTGYYDGSGTFHPKYSVTPSTGTLTNGQTLRTTGLGGTILETSPTTGVVNTGTPAITNTTTKNTGTVKTAINNDPPGKSAEEIQNELYQQRVSNAQNSLKVLLDNINKQVGLAKERKRNVQGHLDTSYWGGNDQVGSLNPTGGLIGSNLAKRDSELALLDEQLGTVNDLYQGNADKGMRGLFDINESNKQNVLTGLDKNAADAGAEADRVLGTNARKFQENNTLNRVLAKARGMGGSSAYDNSQNKARYQAETLNKEVNADKADKIFKTGLEKTDQTNWYDTKGTELRSEHAGKVTAINGEKVSTEQFHNNLDTQYRGDYKRAWDDEENTYNSNVSNLMAQEQIFGIDNADRLDQLYAEHQQRQNAIADYASKQKQTNSAITTDVANKQNTVNKRSSLANIKSTLDNNTAKDSMNSGKLSDTYNTTMADNTANQNSLNAVLDSIKNLGVGTNTPVTGMNIRRPTSLLDEQDKYGYLINNLFGKAYA